ncbi:MAG: ComEA family DNA-binding protein [Campylobacteraceae bacterium]
MKKVMLILLFCVMSLFAKIDINSADAKTLSTLKGVGSQKAEAIVEYRVKNGNFKSVNDLLKVKGIGKKILEDNKDNIEVK